MPISAQIDDILIVEDDYFLATDLSETLQELGCGRISIARTVGEALCAIAGGVRFATVDVKMDGAPCLSIVDALISRDIPLIYVSGYPEADHIELPAAPWVSKPAGRTAVRDALKAISVEA